MSGYTEEHKIKTAKRIKALRLEGGWTQDELVRQITDKYNIDISKSVLINYEIADSNHKRFLNGYGMNIRYLASLADFFGVTTDYILGRTDIKSVKEEVQTTCKYSNLSESAIEKLHDLPTGIEGELDIKIISSLIEDRCIQEIVEVLRDCLIEIQQFIWIYQENYEKANINQMKSTTEYEFNKTVINMYQDMFEKLMEKYKKEIKQIASRRIDKIQSEAFVTIEKMHKILEMKPEYISELIESEE